MFVREVHGDREISSISTKMRWTSICIFILYIFVRLYEDGPFIIFCHILVYLF